MALYKQVIVKSIKLDMTKIPQTLETSFYILSDVDGVAIDGRCVTMTEEIEKLLDLLTDKLRNHITENVFGEDGKIEEPKNDIDIPSL